MRFSAKFAKGMREEKEVAPAVVASELTHWRSILTWHDKRGGERIARLRLPILILFVGRPVAKSDNGNGKRVKRKMGDWLLVLRSSPTDD